MAIKSKDGRYIKINNFYNNYIEYSLYSDEEQRIFEKERLNEINEFKNKVQKILELKSREIKFELTKILNGREVFGEEFKKVVGEEMMNKINNYEILENEFDKIIQNTIIGYDKEPKELNLENKEFFINNGFKEIWVKEPIINIGRIVTKVNNNIKNISDAYNKLKEANKKETYEDC